MPLSPRMTQEVLKARSEETECLLITIKHDSWSDDVRLCTVAHEFLYEDEETHIPVMGIVSRGKQYIYVGVNAILPTSQDEAAPEARFSFSHVGREVGAKLKMVDDNYPLVTIELIAVSEPDFVEMEYPEMKLNTASWDKTSGEVTLIHDVAANEPCPPHRFVKSTFPNLFYQE